jgi:uncharacterized protein (DUF1501 family)
MNRRKFLRSASASALTLYSTRLWAADTDTKLLVVMLRGAYDGLSLLVPHYSSLYYERRPHIAIAKPNPTDRQSAVFLNSDWGLHPSLESTVHALYKNKQIVFVPFSGSADTSRSHFQAQDLMELGRDPRSGLDYQSGWMNRLVSVVGGHSGLGGISFTNNLALAFKGSLNIPNLSVKGKVAGPADKRQTELLESLYQGQKLQTVVQEGMETRRDAAAELDKEMKDSAREAGHAGEFEKSARNIGRLMREKRSYSIAFVDLGGWDTHVNQGNAQGHLSNNFEKLGEGLSAFAETMGPVWDRTVVVVMSEFGRTFKENGSRGTDHGHGNTLWVLGGNIRGGKIAGRQAALNDNNLYQNRDLPILNDYRAVVANLAKRMYGMSAEQIQIVFPSVVSEDFELI